MDIVSHSYVAKLRNFSPNFFFSLNTQIDFSIYAYFDKSRKMFSRGDLEEHAKVLTDTAYNPLSSRKIRAEVIKRLRQKYPKQNLTVALGTVQLRIQRIFSPKLYEKHYNATIPEAADQFLRTQAEQIKEGANDPNYIAPNSEKIIAVCKALTGYSMSLSTIHERFQKFLGKDLFARCYPKIILPVNALVEEFLENKAKELLVSGDKVQSMSTTGMDEPSIDLIGRNEGYIIFDKNGNNWQLEKTYFI